MRSSKFRCIYSMGEQQVNNTFLKTGLYAALTAGAIMSTAAIADIKVGGRIMVDGVVADDDDNGALTSKSGTEFRRARLFAKGKIADEFGYKLQIGFAGNEVTIKDAYIDTKVGGGKFVFGQHKMASGFEERTSSKYITMMERSALTGLSPSRRIGISYVYGMNGFNMQGSFYGQEEDGSEGSEEGLGAGFRASYAFGAADRALFHVGGYLNTEQPSDVEGTPDSRIRLRFRPDNHLADRPISLSNNDPERLNTFGLEGAFLGGPFSVVAELAGGTASSDDNDEEIDALGFSLTGSYFIGGHKKYKKGAFGRPSIKNDFAVELAVRFSTMNIEQGDTEQDLNTITLGSNFYFNKYTRVMLNYVIANAESEVSGNEQFDEDADFLMARFQIDF